MWVGHRQVKTSRELERQREIRKLEAVAAIAIQASVRIEQAMTAIGKVNTWARIQICSSSDLI
jgi:hypothetical protein